MGFRPEQGARRHDLRDLVDRPVSGTGHRADGGGPDTGGRKHQRPERSPAARPKGSRRIRHPRSRRTGNHQHGKKGIMSATPGSVSDRAARQDQRVLEIGHLHVTFATDGGDVPAVKNVSLDVRAGEVLAVVGESGSGKTVTAKTILGLLPETATSSGTVLIRGTNVISVTAEALRQIRGRDVAMVFQEPSTALNPVFTVGWQIAEGIRAHAGTGGKKVSAKEAKARAVEALR